MRDPYFLESCGHTFCRSCIRNEVCPACHISAHAKQITPNRLVANVLLLTAQLKKILDEDTEVTPIKECDDVVLHHTPPLSPISSEESNNSVEKIKSREPKTLDPAAAKSVSINLLEENTNNERAVKKEDSSAPESCHENETPHSSLDFNGSNYNVCSSSMPSTPSNGKALLKVDDSSPRTHSSSASEKKNCKGETPLHLACIKGNVMKVQTLLEEGSNLNVKDNAGWTPLHEACHHDYLEIVKLLVTFGAFINTTGYENETPLHDAVQMNNVEIVTFLVRHGADVAAKNARGLTPTDLAKTKELEDALKTTVSISFAKEPSNAKTVKKVRNRKKHGRKAHQIVNVLCTGLNREQKHLLELCVKMHNVTFLQEFSEKVTHIVTDCGNDSQCVRTLKYLQGVLAGKWILNFTWIDMCIKYKKILEEEAFEVAGTKNYPNSFGARKGRENALKQLPPLFDGCHFYFYGAFDSPWPQRSALSTLIRSGGGKVLNREPRYDMKDDEIHRVPYHSTHKIVNTFVVYAQDRMPKLNHLGDNVRCIHIAWLLDSISTFTLLPFDDYERKI